MIFKTREDYIRTLFAPENNELQNIRNALNHKNDRIAIEPEEGKLLQILIRMINARLIVEIGALTGYSAIWMEQALPEEGKIITIEKDAARARQARQHLGHHPKISLLEGDALTVLPSIEKDGPFDIVFIDADKLHYDRYLDWAERNVRKGGLIIGDNTLLFDAVWSEVHPENVRQAALEAMRSFNKRLANPEKYASLLLPTKEGLTIALKLT